MSDLDIEVGEEESRRRIVNRSINEIFSEFFPSSTSMKSKWTYSIELGKVISNNRSIVRLKAKNEIFQALFKSNEILHSFMILDYAVSLGKIFMKYST